MSGKLIVGLNPHGEITSLIFPGRVALTKAQIMNCIKNAFSKAKASAEMVQKAVDEDLEKRKALVKPAGFTDCLTSDATYMKSKLTKVYQDKMRLMEFKVLQESQKMVEETADNNVARHVVFDDSDEETMASSSTMQVDDVVEAKTQKISKPIEVESDSEEEELSAKLTAADIQ